jgi:uncharacterized membrane protein
MQFSGPLPPPELLIRYNDAVPNGAERIMAMAENQSQHRQILEKDVIAAGILAQKVGSILGFVICIAALASGTFLIFVGRSAAGLVPIIGALGGLVAVFVLGKQQQQNDLAQKSAAIIPSSTQHSQ